MTIHKRQKKDADNLLRLQHPLLKSILTHLFTDNFINGVRTNTLKNSARKNLLRLILLETISYPKSYTLHNSVSSIATSIILIMFSSVQPLIKYKQQKVNRFKIDLHL